jgi:hypothetical protein
MTSAPASVSELDDVDVSGPMPAISKLLRRDGGPASLDQEPRAVHLEAPGAASSCGAQVISVRVTVRSRGQHDALRLRQDCNILRER